MAVVAQFFYVGAQVGVWSYLIRYAEGTIPGTADRTAADYLLISLVLFMLGRFIGTALMRIIAPAKLLAAFAAVNALLSMIGGAVLTPAMGAISGLTGIQGAMIVPLISFGVVLAFALHVAREARS
jgi:FHS family L-fucose permease-like MFS transporter